MAGRRGLAVAVRVMASHASQVAIALRVAAAPGEGRRLEAVPDGVGPGAEITLVSWRSWHWLHDLLATGPGNRTGLTMAGSGKLASAAAT